jgi:hypothetical protein
MTDQTHTKESKVDNKESKTIKARPVKLLKRFATALGVLLLMLVVAYGYGYATTPANIRSPAFEHYHFRTQIIVNDQPVDFSRDEFQQEYDATSCSTEVGGTPVDFHDNVDQFTHIHWKGVTGGQFLKYFGWNFIGGSDEIIGRRYDNGMVPQMVKIFGKLLPETPKDAQYFIYIGDKDNYQQKNWQDFINQDLEQFFGKESSVGKSSAIDRFKSLIFARAYAHGKVKDDHSTNKTEEELTRINNLIGNTVIFVQNNEPTDDQIKNKFNNLVPLTDSTCGG